MAFRSRLLSLQDLSHRDDVISQRPNHPRLHRRALHRNLSSAAHTGRLQQLEKGGMGCSGRVVHGLLVRHALPPAHAPLILLRRAGRFAAVQHRACLATAHASCLSILHFPPLHPAYDRHHHSLHPYRHYPASFASSTSELFSSPPVLPQDPTPSG